MTAELRAVLVAAVVLVGATAPGTAAARTGAGTGAAAGTGGATHRLAPGDPWPRLAEGDRVVLAPGRYPGPWEIEVPGVRIDADGAELAGPPDGSALVLAAPGIEVHGLRVRDGGRVADLYAPDAAVWLVGCHGCRLEGIDTAGTPGGLRIEASRDVTVANARLAGAADGPGLTAYLADGLRVEATRVTGWLDGIYVERSDDVRIVDATVAGARRYGLHAMFGRGLEVVDTVVQGGGVGSAVMYGRDALLLRDRFEGHVGPLAYGLLLQEMAGAVVRDSEMVDNTVGMLVVSAPDVRLEGNELRGSGTGLLVRRTPDAATSAVRATGNRFFANVADVAVDDPDAAVTLVGNGYDAASRLDRDGDGVSDAAYLPTSSFALLSSRTPDLSLFALSSGVRLWEAAEASVPGLRMATLHDPAPHLLPRASRRTDETAGTLAAAALIAVALAGGAVLSGRPGRPAARRGRPSAERARP